MECVVSYKFFTVGNFYLAVLFVLVGWAFLKKKKDAAYLILLTSLFYLVSKLLHCQIKAVDIAYFRYLAWTCLDALYLFTVYCLLFKSYRVKTYVLALLVVCHCFIWIFHLLRVVDVRYLRDFDFAFEYGIGIAVCNFLVVAIVSLPLLPKSLNNLRSTIDDGFSDVGSSGSDHGNFAARINVS